MIGNKARKLIGHWQSAFIRANPDVAELELKTASDRHEAIPTFDDWYRASKEDADRQRREKMGAISNEFMLPSTMWTAEDRQRIRDTLKGWPQKPNTIDLNAAKSNNLGHVVGSKTTLTFKSLREALAAATSDDIILRAQDGTCTIERSQGIPITYNMAGQERVVMMRACHA